MDRLLVVGASGLLGSKCMLLAKGRYEAVGTYNTHLVEGGIKMDVTNRAEVFSVVEKAKPDLVIDTHALHNVDYCETHPEESWAVNVEGTKNVAEAAKKAGAKYIFISTDYVFDGKKTKYAEKDKPLPLNYYGKSKRAAEVVLDALGINHIVVRAAVTFGVGGMGKTSFVLWLVDKLKKGEKVNIVADQHNNPTYVDNLVEMIFKLYEVDANGIFHATGKDCMSRYEFSLLTAKVFGLDASLINSITTPELKQVAQRPLKVNLNTNKIERVSGLKTLTAEEGLNLLKAQVGG